MYLNEQIHPNDRVKMVKGRIKESIRLASRVRSSQKPKVFAYVTYLFTDTKQPLSKVSSVYRHWYNAP